MWKDGALPKLKESRDLTVLDAQNLVVSLVMHHGFHIKNTLVFVMFKVGREYMVKLSSKCGNNKKHCVSTRLRNAGVATALLVPSREKGNIIYTHLYFAYMYIFPYSLLRPSKNMLKISFPVQSYDSNQALDLMVPAIGFLALRVQGLSLGPRV